MNLSLSPFSTIPRTLASRRTGTPADYGLFAANPLGEKVFSNDNEELNFSLAPHASVVFRYRILISSAILTPETTEAAYKDFLAADP
jgi:hypothetical protein